MRSTKESSKKYVGDECLNYSRKWAKNNNEPKYNNNLKHRSKPYSDEY